MVKCPNCHLELLSTTKDFTISVDNIPIGIVPFEVANCEPCGQRYVLVAVKIGDNALNITAGEKQDGKAQ